MPGDSGSSYRDNEGHFHVSKLCRHFADNLSKLRAVLAAGVGLETSGPCDSLTPASSKDLVSALAFAADHSFRGGRWRSRLGHQTRQWLVSHADRTVEGVRRAGYALEAVVSVKLARDLQNVAVRN